MAAEKTVTLEISKGVARVTLNRPDLCNALNDELINDLTTMVANIHSAKDVRVVVITGANNCFCGGVDIGWMEKMAKDAPNDDGRRLAHLLFTVKTIHLPTIALIDGPCVGGGIALATCCDIAIASEEASFALPAVRLGASPTIVTPFIVNAIGAHQARRFLLTGEVFSAEKAKEINLIHAVCMRAQMEETLAGFIDQLVLGGPEALATCKDMIAYSEKHQLDNALIEEAARRATKIRQSEEAQEGLQAYKEKREPAWTL